MQRKRTSMKDFSIEQKLGEGAFGVVYKAKRIEDGKIYAMKKVKIGNMKDKEKENAVNEIRILASVNDQYIIGYKDAFFDQISNTLCIIMEYAEQGDLLKKINQHIKGKTHFKEEEIWKALSDIIRGIKSLHQKKILHRDLKCANIFVSKDGTYKLGDLNVSKVLKKELAYTQIGTPYYASPEVWLDKPYNAKSDIWSLGCVIYQMAALQPPFQAKNLEGLFKKVKIGKFDRIPGVYSHELANMISLMLKVNPSERISSEEIINHRQFKRRLQVGNYQAEEVDFKGELLKTIKFSPYNLRALQDKLPPSNYQRHSRFLPDIQPQREMRDRVFSASNIRNYSSEGRGNKVNNCQNTPKIPHSKVPPLPPGAHRLPPRPNVASNHDEKGNNMPPLSISRQRSKENLRRIGYNILTGRSNSVQRDY